MGKNDSFFNFRFSKHHLPLIIATFVLFIFCLIFINAYAASEQFHFYLYGQEGIGTVRLGNHSSCSTDPTAFCVDYPNTAKSALDVTIYKSGGTTSNQMYVAPTTGFEFKGFEVLNSDSNFVVYDESRLRYTFTAEDAATAVFRPTSSSSYDVMIEYGVTPNGSTFYTFDNKDSYINSNGRAKKTGTLGITEPGSNMIKYADYLISNNENAKVTGATYSGEDYFLYWINEKGEIVSLNKTFIPTEDQIYDGAKYYAYCRSAKRFVVTSSDEDAGKVLIGTKEISGYGMVSTDTSYHPSSKISVKENKKYEFDHWTITEGTHIGNTEEIDFVDAENNFIGKEFQSELTFNFSKYGYGITLITAYFNKISDYTIHYEVETGGTISNEADVFDEEDTPIGSKVISVSYGYKFMGWYEGETYITDEVDFPIQDFKKNGATYTAKFKDIRIHINYEATNDGIVTEFDDDTVEKNIEQVVELNEVTGVKAKSTSGNYVFESWINENGEVVSESDVFVPQGEDQIYDGATYTAIFTLADNIINYRAVQYRSSTLFITDNDRITNTKDSVLNSKPETVKGSKVSKEDEWFFAYWIEEGNTSTIISLDEEFIPEGEQIKNTTYLAVFYKDVTRYVVTTNNEKYGAVYSSSTASDSNLVLNLYNRQLTKKADVDEYETHMSFYALPASDIYDFDHWEINGEVFTQNGIIYRGNRFESAFTVTTESSGLYEIKAVFRIASRAKYSIVTDDDYNVNIGGSYEYLNSDDETMPGVRAIPTSNYFFGYWGDASKHVISTYEEFKPTEEQLLENDMYYAYFFSKSNKLRLFFISNVDGIGTVHLNNNSKNYLNEVASLDTISEGVYGSTHRYVAEVLDEYKDEYVFDHWELDDNVLYCMEDTCTYRDRNSKNYTFFKGDMITVDEMMNLFTTTNRKAVIRAVFRKVDEIPIRYKATIGGTVTNETDFISLTQNPEGSTAKADSGYEFVEWIKGDEHYSNELTILPTVEEETIFTAIFKSKTSKKIAYNMNIKDAIKSDITWKDGYVGIEGSTERVNNSIYFFGNESYAEDMDGKREYKVTSNIPMYDGYIFIGWFDRDRTSYGGNAASIIYAGDTVEYVDDGEDYYILDALWAKVNIGDDVIVNYDGLDHTIDDVTLDIDDHIFTFHSSSELQDLGELKYTIKYKESSQEEYTEVNPTYKKPGIYTTDFEINAGFGINTVSSLKNSSEVKILDISIEILPNTGSFTNLLFIIIGVLLIMVSSGTYVLYYINKGRVIRR